MSKNAIISIINLLYNFYRQISTHLYQNKTIFAQINTPFFTKTIHFCAKIFFLKKNKKNMITNTIIVNPSITNNIGLTLYALYFNAQSNKNIVKKNTPTKTVTKIFFNRLSSYFYLKL